MGLFWCTLKIGLFCEIGCWKYSKTIAFNIFEMLLLPREGHSVSPLHNTSNNNSPIIDHDSMTTLVKSHCSPCHPVTYVLTYLWCHAKGLLPVLNIKVVLSRRRRGSTSYPGLCTVQKPYQSLWTTQRPWAQNTIQKSISIVFWVSAIRHDLSLIKYPKQKQSPPGSVPFWIFPGGEVTAAVYDTCWVTNHDE
jgi:hypothetical protein